MSTEKHEQNCKEIFSLLSDYLNLELPPDACKEIEMHLAGCPPCIEFAESLRKTVELCRNYSSAQMPVPLQKEARKKLLETYKKMIAARQPAQ